MSRIRANTITNLTIDGPPTVSTGLQVTGVTTSTSFTATTSTLVGSAVTTDTQGVRVAGIVTATSFTGDGANLTGLNIPAGLDWRDISLF